MDYDVTFLDVVSEISIHPALISKQVKFISRSQSGIVNPKNNVTYPNITAMQVFCHLDKEPIETRTILEPLEVALYLAEEIITGLVASTQESMFISKPIKCVYNGKTYILEDSFWHEYSPDIETIYGGEAFVDDLAFIDEPKNFSPMYHMYRIAKDGSLPKDYRALNLWRFFEAFYGKKNSDLRNYLVEEGLILELKAKRFYNGIRCAVAHAVEMHKDVSTEKVLIPRSIETEFDGGLLVDFLDMLKVADVLVRKSKPVPDTTNR